jgi:transaldolase
MSTAISPFKNKIKIFLDTSAKPQMLEALKLPYVKGFTTNPSLMRKAGVSDYTSFCKDMLTQIKDHPISFEIFSDDPKEILAQAKIIREWGKNVYVKVPVINSSREYLTPVVRELSQSGTQLNVTAIFTLEQVQKTCEALKGGAPSVVSVFAGRISDTGRDPMPLMRDSAKLCREAGPQVELLWASCREFLNIVQAEECGCQIITVPPDVLAKYSGLNKDPGEMSLETVKTFMKDAQAAGFSL